MSNDNLPSKTNPKVLHGEFIGKDEDSYSNDQKIDFPDSSLHQYFGGSFRKQSPFYNYLGNMENPIGEGNLFKDLFSNFLSPFRR